MFQKLKIQLILINAISLTVVLALVFTGIYTLMKKGMDVQTHAIMVSIAKNEELFKLLTSTDRAWIQNNTFFLRFDSDDQLDYYKADFTLPKDDITYFETYLKTQNSDSGYFSNKKYNLKYLKYEKANGYIVVFLDNHTESFILSSLITTSLIVGMVSLSLVCVISWFLANKAIAPVKKNWEAQTEFVADASHELRTPLAVMTSNLEVVLDNEEETIKEQSHWLNNIKEELDRVQKLVNDLLQLARFDAKEELFLSESFDIHPLIQQAIVNFQPLAAKRHIRIFYNPEDQSPLYLMGNPYRIKQLLTILIDNAILYNNDFGLVSIHSNSQNGMLHLSITDTGEGIASEQLSKIFDRFYRIDKSRSRSNGGSGLGLSIAKCIVTEHKGKINVTSTLGQGTCFSMSFPLDEL